MIKIKIPAGLQLDRIPEFNSLCCVVLSLSKSLSAKKDSNSQGSTGLFTSHHRLQVIKLFRLEPLQVEKSYYRRNECMIWNPGKNTSSVVGHQKYREKKVCPLWQSRVANLSVRGRLMLAWEEETSLHLFVGSSFKPCIRICHKNLVGS